MPPRTTARWILKGQNGFDSLAYEEKAAIPELGSEDVLVELHAASLNHRELIITRVCGLLDIREAAKS
jgi:NADPH:quinone reductase-like Zn-dependent oxidoreductase